MFLGVGLDGPGQECCCGRFTTPDSTRIREQVLETKVTQPGELPLPSMTACICHPDRSVSQDTLFSPPSSLSCQPHGNGQETLTQLFWGPST